MKSLITKILIVTALITMAGAANGFMDALQFHGAWSKLGNEQFWNPNKSWINKWEIDEAGKAIAEKTVTKIE